MRTRKNKILIAGVDCIMDKLFHMRRNFNALGFDYSIYAPGQRGRLARVCEEMRIAYCAAEPCCRLGYPLGVLREFVRFYRFARREDPIHVDLFANGSNPLSIVIYLLVCVLRGIPVVFWCRGGELLNWDSHSFLHKRLILAIVRKARLIVLKEAYMDDIMQRINPAALTKCAAIHNTIIISDDKKRDIPRESERMLFLNHFKKWRNVPMIIDALHILKQRGYMFHVDLVGVSERSSVAGEESVVARKIKSYDLIDCVDVFPFTDDPARFYERSGIFLLPADIVYCNYALLEAMSWGLTPVVTDTDPAGDRIVKHNLNGLRIRKDAKALADALEILLNDRASRLRMGREARNTVECDFNTDAMFNRYLRLLEDRVWIKQGS